MTFLEEVQRRRTFAIISHPDAGKTTLTEKLLLYGGAIHLAGSVKSRKTAKHAVSDWMEIEKQRGISVTSSVLQFDYDGCRVNILDTPGHQDFSEDTYRTLMAADSAVMLIDVAKGVEAQTKKLFAVSKERGIPIFTFVNKIDHFGRNPFDLMEEIENVLGIRTCPMNWPIGINGEYKGVYDREHETIELFAKDETHGQEKLASEKGALTDPRMKELLGDDVYQALLDDIELLDVAGDPFDFDKVRAGELTPMFFGSAMTNFGVKPFLEKFLELAPSPAPRQAIEEVVQPTSEDFSALVFKIQANMDPKHRDRVAFLRVVSGKYEKGMKLKHVRIGKDVVISDALTFMAGDRTHADEAYAGDIIGLHNHGTIQIGDTFTQGEELKFTGIPNFAPELFRRIRLKDPLKQKQLLKGLVQLSEEGAVQVFRPLSNNDLIVGAVGVLQFDVVVSRLKSEYNVEAIYETVNVATARWVECADNKKFEEFKRKNEQNLALDGGDNLAYIAPTMVNLNLSQERYPDVTFFKTREH